MIRPLAVLAALFALSGAGLFVWHARGPSASDGSESHNWLLFVVALCSVCAWGLTVINGVLAVLP